MYARRGNSVGYRSKRRCCPVENLPPIGDRVAVYIERSYRTRTFCDRPRCWLPTKSARISVRLFVVAVFVDTTLGLAETDADSESLRSPQELMLALDCTLYRWVFVTPPAVATMSRLPVVDGAVYIV